MGAHGTQDDEIGGAQCVASTRRRPRPLICRYRLPVVTIILNNNGIYRGDPIGSECSPTGLMHNARYDKMIEAFGGTGFHVTDTISLTGA